jgi:hypothetical protein
MRFICVLGLLMLLPIQSAVADISWYLGLGGGITKLHSTDFASTSGLDGLLMVPTDSISSGEFTDNPLGWQFFGAVMFNENFGVMLKYNESGEGEDQWDTTTRIGTTPAVVTNYSTVGQMQVDGLTIYALQTIPFANKFEFTFEAGVTRQAMEFVWVTSPNPGSGLARQRITDDSVGFALGGVLRYKFFKHFAMSGEIEYINVDFDNAINKPIRYGANLEFHF